jgi:hypothetical protein
MAALLRTIIFQAKIGRAQQVRLSREQMSMMVCWAAQVKINLSGKIIFHSRRGPPHQLAQLQIEIQIPTPATWFTIRVCQVVKITTPHCIPKYRWRRLLLWSRGNPKSLLGFLEAIRYRAEINLWILWEVLDIQATLPLKTLTAFWYTIRLHRQTSCPWVRLRPIKLTGNRS